MPFWALAVLFVAATVAIYVFMPRPETPPDAQTEEFDGPDTEEGKSIPVVFGTREIFPSVLWYGDIRTEEIMSDEDGGGGKK